MLNRVGLLLAAGVLSAGVVTPAMAMPLVGAQGYSAAVTNAKQVRRPAVRIGVPKNVNEGDRVKVKVRVGSPKLAKTVRLLKEVKSIYGTTTWTAVKSRKVRGMAAQQFTAVATGENMERYRAAVVYKKIKKPVMSKRVKVTVWRWIDLAAFGTYFSTGGILDGYYLPSFAMNGTQYNGWSTFGAYRSWESRHTSGRNCKAFRADLGVTDNSNDGSSAAITFRVDESKAVYTSPTLTPGMVQRVRLRLPMPYRFSIQARNTSPDGVWAYPALGNPQFLCTY